MTDTTKPASELADGDWFSLDGGETWHIFAIAGFGTVSCYMPGSRRLTYRVPVGADQLVDVPVGMVDGAGLCSDCFERLDDPEHHCPECGDHVDGLGECNSGCES